MYDATDGIVSSRVPTSTLNPPHFDGVESVVWGGGHLFSASRDATIKKWHLQTKKEKGVSGFILNSVCAYCDTKNES